MPKLQTLLQRRPTETIRTAIPKVGDVVRFLTSRTHGIGPEVEVIGTLQEDGRGKHVGGQYLFHAKSTITIMKRHGG